MSEPKLTLTIGGASYEGWEDIRVSRSLDTMADSFSVSYTEVSGNNASPVPIYEGQKVIVKIDSTPVIVGYVDDTDKGYSDGQTRTSIGGRSLMGDLVDCAAVYKTGEWVNAGVKDIITAIAKPFGITVAAKTDLGAPLRKFCLQDSESAADAISRAAAMRAVLVTATTDGTIVLTRAGAMTSNTVLGYGRNAKQASVRSSWKDRYSNYTLKAQLHGDDTSYGGPAAFIKQSVSDSRINRYRPTIIMAENEDSGPELLRRATWERNVRAGRGRTLTYEVQGWYDDDGKLWTPNTLVRVDDSYFSIQDQLLIVAVDLEKGNQGTIASLQLTAKEAYDVFELPPKKPRRSEGYYDDGS